MEIIIANILLLVCSIFLTGINILILIWNKKNNKVLEAKSEIDDMTVAENVLRDDIFRQIDKARTRAYNNMVTNNTDENGIFEGVELRSLDDLGYFAGVEYGE